MQLDEILEQTFDVVLRIGATGMPRKLHLLHRRQPGEHLARQDGGLVFQAPQLGAEAGILAGQLTQLAHARDELDDGAFECEDYCHGWGSGAAAKNAAAGDFGANSGCCRGPPWVSATARSSPRRVSAPETLPTRLAVAAQAEPRRL